MTIHFSSVSFFFYLKITSKFETVHDHLPNWNMRTVYKNIVWILEWKTGKIFQSTDKILRWKANVLVNYF